MSFLNRRRRPQPHEVFTPGSLPLEHHNIYVHRFGAEESLSRFIKRQQVPVVFGGYGVGKTTLVKKYFQDDASANRLVYIAADPSLTMTDFFAVILESLHYTVETETVEKKSTKNDGGFDTRVLKATHGRQRDTEKRSSLFVKSPTDVGILEIIDEARLTIVIDEMHKCSPMFRQELADFIKGVKTHGSTNTRLVLVGTTADAERLVAADPGIDRYLKELEVPLLLPTEALSLVREGLARLGIEITDGLCTRVIDLAAGAPTIIHAIALEIAESTLARQDVVVTESDCIIAVRRYLQEHGRRLAGIYLKAIETTGTKRYRKRILHAAAHCEHDYLTMEDIRIGVSADLNETVSTGALSGPLRALKEPAYGPILQDVQRSSDRRRIHNLTTFSDPMMKSFIRFINRVDGAGYLPSPAELDRGR